MRGGVELVTLANLLGLIKVGVVDRDGREDSLDISANGLFGVVFLNGLMDGRLIDDGGDVV
jgi:hypothetical protein